MFTGPQHPAKLACLPIILGPSQSDGGQCSTTVSPDLAISLLALTVPR